MDLEELLGYYFYKKEVKNILGDMGEKKSGTKGQLISRILKRRPGRRDVRNYLQYPYKDELKWICRDLDIPVSGTRDELIRRILPHVEIPRRKPKKAKPKKKAKPLAGVQGMRKLIREVERWTPRMKYKSEEGYRADLAGYLDHRLGYRIRQERGVDNPDILVEGAIPIELKKNPNKTSYNRLFGQLVDFADSYGSAVAIMCDVTRGELFEDFQSKVRTLLGDRVKVLKTS